MKQVVRTSDVLTKKNVIKGISDIPGGISIDLSTLVAGAAVPEANPLSAASSGIRKVCKQGLLLTGTTTTSLVVATATNHFKVGDNIFRVVGGPAYDADSVTDNGDGTTTIVVGTAITGAAAGQWIYEGSGAEGADTGAFENSAEVIAKHAFEVPSDTQVIWIADAYIRADVVENCIAPLHLAQVSGIQEVKY
jgi:hypothetical protein